MNSEADLSIVIVNWNTRDLLIQCLESVHRTKQGLGVEIFVVDNGSKDQSSAAVKENFSETIVIQNQGNAGFARANNQALRQAKGKYLMLLNPDTQVKEGAFQQLISFMETHPEAGMAGPQLMNEDGSKQNSIANTPSLATELLNKSLLRRLFPKRFPGKERQYTDAIEVDSIIGACMIVRREAMEKTGLLDEDYFLFLEETDWCYRMKKKGWKIYHVPQAEVIHLQGKTANRVKPEAKIEYYRSLYLFFKKHKGDAQSQLLKVFLFIRFCVDFILAVFSCLVTAFRKDKLKGKMAMYAKLIYWHMKRCPEGMGLKGKPAG